jgi:hypothetical protein
VRTYKQIQVYDPLLRKIVHVLRRACSVVSATFPILLKVLAYKYMDCGKFVTDRNITTRRITEKYLLTGTISVILNLRNRAYGIVLRIDMDAHDWCG